MSGRTVTHAFVVRTVVREPMGSHKRWCAHL